MTANESDEWMLIGRIAGAFGVRGEAKVDLHTDFPERFVELEIAYLGRDHHPYEVESGRLHGRQVVLKLRGIDTPEAVSRLRGQDVEIPRDEAVDSRMATSSWMTSSVWRWKRHPARRSVPSPTC